MKTIIISTAFMIAGSMSAFANSGPLLLKCNNTDQAIKNQLTMMSNADGSMWLFSSKSPNSQRGVNIPLKILSAGHGMMTLANEQLTLKVVVNLSQKPSAAIFDEQGIVSTCQ